MLPVVGPKPQAPRVTEHNESYLSESAPGSQGLVKTAAFPNRSVVHTKIFWPQIETWNTNKRVESPFIKSKLGKKRLPLSGSKPQSAIAHKPYSDMERPKEFHRHNDARKFCPSARGYSSYNCYINESTIPFCSIDSIGACKIVQEQKSDQREELVASLDPFLSIIPYSISSI